MALINKTGITDGGLIQAEHVTRIIDALSGVSADSIVATGSFQGTLNGIASLASTASYVTTAQTASYVLNAVSASFSTSASRSTTSSFSLVATSASFASNAFFGVSASLAQTAQTASYVLNAVSASFAATASFVLSGVTASFATSASQAISSSRAITASFATSAATASFIVTAQTASYVLNAVSASFATSASRAVSASFTSTASFVTQLNQTVNVTGSLNINRHLSFISSSNIPAGVSGSAIFASSDGTPNAGRLFIGDGTGWQFHFSRRASNSTTDLISITDTGVIKLADGDGSSFLFKVSNTSAAGTVIYTSRTDGTQGGSLRSDGWGNFSFNNSLAVGKEVAGGTSAVRLDVNGNAVITGSMQINTGNTTTNQTAFQVVNSNSNGFYVVPNIGGAFNYFNLSAAGDVGIIGSTGENLIIGAGNGAAWKFLGTNNTPENGQMYTLANVGIAASNPAFKLHVGANSAAKPGGGSWSDTSDARLKENIELADLDLCYDVVKNLPLKRYRWKDNSYTDTQIIDRNVVGWIAQDVAAVFPKAVSETPFTQVDGTTIDDCLTLNETLINRTLYGAVQKLIAENETLKSELQLIKAHLGL